MIITITINHNYNHCYHYCYHYYHNYNYSEREVLTILADLGSVISNYARTGLLRSDDNETQGEEDSGDCSDSTVE